LSHRELKWKDGRERDADKLLERARWSSFLFYFLLRGFSAFLRNVYGYYLSCVISIQAVEISNCNILFSVYKILSFSKELKIKIKFCFSL